MHFLSIFFLSLFLFVQNSGFSEEVRYYWSQCGQDSYLNQRLFKGKKNGVFVDIGAHNGITYSNTYFYEKFLGWKGICIEPIPQVFDQLQKNRNCICVKGCITPKEEKLSFLQVNGNGKVEVEMLSGIFDKYHPEHLKRVQREVAACGGSFEIIQVDGYVLNALLKKHNMFHIDFLSLDTEGGELEILQSIDFSKFKIDVIAVENNNNTPFEPFLKSKGFTKLANFPWDEIYVRNAILNQVQD